MRVEYKNMYMADALEFPVQFLIEQRTELYEQYCSGVAQVKIVLGTKNGLQSCALLNLERRGA
jgi:hypothetical protein